MGRLAGGVNSPRPRKRIEAETGSLKRARDGSAFTKCEACNKDVPVVLIDMHSCSLDSKIRMNLESQIVEKAPESKKPPVERKKTAMTEPKAKKSKREKKVKDPNKPKRPPTAFFLFMNDFRKTFKEANPNEKSVAVVAKEGGEKWKSLTDEDKKQYTDKVAELKAEYEKAMEKYNNGDKEEEEEEKEQDQEQEKEQDQEEEKEGSGNEE